MAQAKKQRPEALATFAEAARGEGKKPDDLGLVANAKTAPIATDSKMKDEAATRVLQEGATGEDRKSDEMIDRLPDRIIESRSGAGREEAFDEAAEEPAESYDATRDPRTGRPPTGVEAEQLKQDRLAGKALDQSGSDANDDFDEADEIEELNETKLSGVELEDDSELGKDYRSGGDKLGP